MIAPMFAAVDDETYIATLRLSPDPDARIYDVTVPIEPWSRDRGPWEARDRACSSLLNQLIGATSRGAVVLRIVGPDSSVCWSCGLRVDHSVGHACDMADEDGL